MEPFEHKLLRCATHSNSTEPLCLHSDAVTALNLSVLIVLRQKLINFPKLTVVKIAPKQSTAQQLSNEWSHLRVLSIE